MTVDYCFSIVVYNVKLFKLDVMWFNLRSQISYSCLHMENSRVVLMESICWDKLSFLDRYDLKFSIIGYCFSTVIYNVKLVSSALLFYECYKVNVLHIIIWHLVSVHITYFWIDWQIMMPMEECLKGTSASSSGKEVVQEVPSNAIDSIENEEVMVTKKWH